MGALQVNGVMEFVWGIPTSTTVQMVFIAVTTMIFVLSATTGVGNPVIQRLLIQSSPIISP